MNLPTDVVHRVIDHLQKTPAALLPAATRARIQAAVDSFDIYRWIRNTKTADVAWQLGFREVNYHGPTDYPAVAFTPWDASLIEHFHSEEYILWLLDHGADPLQPLHDTRNRDAPVLAIHTVIHNIRVSNIRYPWPLPLFEYTGEMKQVKLSEAAQEVVRRLCSERITDGCVCACSANGCTPSLILLRNMVLYVFAHHRSLSPRPKDYAEEFSYLRIIFCQNDGFVSQYEGGSHEALRLFTSTALGIRHTCCKWDGYHNGDDAEEIREEDSELTDILECLMEEWQGVSFQSTNEFWLFLQDKWVVRLDEVFEELRKMDESEENRARLQSLGVQLHESVVESTVPEPPVRRRDFIWREESFWLGLFDAVAEGHDTSYFDRVLDDAEDFRYWSRSEK